MERLFSLHELSGMIPRGTRVAVTKDVYDDVATASTGVVTETQKNQYEVRLDDGRQRVFPRAALVAQRDISGDHSWLAAEGRRQWHYRRLRKDVILQTIVGSHAFGLAHAQSDVDVRGIYLAPFAGDASLFSMPNEIHDVTSDESYWEAEAFIRQALRADPNTLEMLHSPLVKEATPEGQLVLDHRRLFSSKKVVGSFGRYAQRQLQKLQGGAQRQQAIESLLDACLLPNFSRNDAIALLEEDLPGDGERILKDVLQSNFDKGTIAARSIDAFVEVASQNAGLLLAKDRPKNAMNLLRLLHSCVHFLQHEVPLMEVPTDLKRQLLEVKEGLWSSVQLDTAVGQATLEIEERLQETTLPDEPDVEGANALLILLRQRAARKYFTSLGSPIDDDKEVLEETGSNLTAKSASTLQNKLDFLPTPLPTDLPIDVDTARLMRFLSRYTEDAKRLPLMWISLTGAHAYGFASPHSDLDLKAIHVVSARSALLDDDNLKPVESIVDFEGREMDFGTHDLRLVLDLLRAGNGNMLERLLGPFPVWTTPLGSELQHLAQRGLHCGAAKHYQGFLRGMEREFLRTVEAGQPSAKRALYAFRVALTGAKLLSEGEMVTDIRPLASERSLDFVEELIDVKSQKEKAVLSQAQAARVESYFPQMRDWLSDAQKATELPQSIPNGDELQEFLVRSRFALEDT
ncbi:MAG: hypothetical protein GY822_31400 [Deltaproteobacteria bacterium]|nr:hypothetical protein [Deltaproteobacteria bacterium]